MNTAPAWVRSSYSSQDGGNCVEWAPAVAAATGVVPVRDSKAPERPALAVSGAAWTGLVEFAKAAAI
ncbi:DUF397 domain-containing protein [Streptomyces cyaneofuscatus]